MVSPRLPPADRPDGFTLLELLAVFILVGILTGIVLGVGRRASESGKVARAKAELAVLSAALESYRHNYGDYPNTDDEAQLLRALLGQRGPVSAAMIPGRALIEAGRFAVVGQVLADPWGRPYVYAYKAPAAGWTNPGFVLYSGGPDEAEFSHLLEGGFPDMTAAENIDNIGTKQ